MSELNLSLVRDIKTKDQTQGQLFVLDGNLNVVFQCFTLELPWKNNKSNVSCIPDGEYNVKKRHSEKYGWHFHILDVPGRSYILIHEANYVSELEGCIAVGKNRRDINNDGLDDVTSSVDTKEKLLSILPEEFIIIISGFKET